jgi:type VI protein secretion system component VasK
MPVEIAGMVLGAFVMTLITIVVVVVLWRGMEVARTKLSADKSSDYQRLAAQSVALQEEIATEQRKTREALEEIRSRLAAVEKLLREVG